MFEQAEELSDASRFMLMVKLAGKRQWIPRWIWIAPLCLAAQPPDPAEAIRASMAASIEKQRASVRTQTRAPLTASGFFTVDWNREAGAAGVAAAPPPCDPLPVQQLAPPVEESARREGLTPDLLRALIRTESGGRPCAVSSAGAMGLMQLMPDTVRQFQVLNPFDPRQSIEAGSKFLKQLIDRYKGDIPLALGAYNAGPGRVDEHGGIPPFPETRRYVSDVMRQAKIE